VHAAIVESVRGGNEFSVACRAAGVVPNTGWDGCGAATATTSAGRGRTTIRSLLSEA
jgi:hypothetical protein